MHITQPSDSRPRLSLFAWIIAALCLLQAGLSLSRLPGARPSGEVVVQAAQSAAPALRGLLQPCQTAGFVTDKTGPAAYNAFMALRFFALPARLEFSDDPEVLLGDFDDPGALADACTRLGRVASANPAPNLYLLTRR